MWWPSPRERITFHAPTPLPPFLHLIKMAFAVSQQALAAKVAVAGNKLNVRKNVKALRANTTVRAAATATVSEEPAASLPPHALLALSEPCAFFL